MNSFSQPSRNAWKQLKMQKWNVGRNTRLIIDSIDLNLIAEVKRINELTKGEMQMDLKQNK